MGRRRSIRALKRTARLDSRSENPDNLRSQTIRRGLDRGCVSSRFQRPPAMPSSPSSHARPILRVADLPVPPIRPSHPRARSGASGLSAAGGAVLRCGAMHGMGRRGGLGWGEVSSADVARPGASGRGVPDAAVQSAGVHGYGFGAPNTREFSVRLPSRRADMTRTPSFNAMPARRAAGIAMISTNHQP